MAIARQVATVATPVAAQIPGSGNFYGIAATNGLATAVYFVKLYWQPSATAPPTTVGGIQTTTNPSVGTTVPHMTIPIPIGGLFQLSIAPIMNGGPLWYWVSSAPGPLDATVLTAGGDQITFILG
jgi:hypothetical protein